MIRWAPRPTPAVFEPLVPAADQTPRPAKWRYTLTEPGAGWETPDFDDTAWAEGAAGFGSPGTPGSIIGTEWKTASIWIRRTFNVPTPEVDKVRLWVHHDEDADVYINGVLACRLRGYSVEYEDYEISTQALATLKPEKNTLAVHCRQTTGGQYIDVGLVRMRQAKSEI